MSEFCFCAISSDFPAQYLQNLSFLLHENRCSGDIVRFSDNSSLGQNFVSAQYLENKLTEFHQYAFILTGSSLGLLAFVFCLFVTELWPLIYVRISFSLNILSKNGHILTELYITIYIDKI